VALTGRVGVLALVGVFLVGFLLPSGWGVLALAALLATLVVVDLVLAGSVRALVLGRAGDLSVRLGERATVTLLVTNPSGRRVRGLLRDAWPPSAGAVTTRHRVDVPPGERRRIDTVLHPTRRGDRPAYRVTVRSIGPLGLAARQGSRNEMPNALGSAGSFRCAAIGVQLVRNAL